MTPFLPSWLGNTTSPLILLDGTAALTPVDTSPGVCECASACAGFGVELDIHATCMGRSGMMAVDGLAMWELADSGNGAAKCVVPRSAIDAAERDDNSIAKTVKHLRVGETGKKGGRVERRRTSGDG